MPPFKDQLKPERQVVIRAPIVLALDPGGTTGIAWRLPDLTYHTQTCPDADCLYEIMCHGQPDIVIIENFETGGRVNQYSIYTIELVGASVALAYAIGATVYRHMPRDRKPFVTKAAQVLTATRGPGQGSGVRNPNWVVHEKDALAHLFTWEWLNENDPNYKPVYKAGDGKPAIATSRDLAIARRTIR